MTEQYLASAPATDFERIETVEAIVADELWARAHGEFDAAAFYQSLARAVAGGQLSLARVKGCTNDYLAWCLLCGGATQDRLQPQDIPR